jgi:glucoamylase
MPSPLSDQGFDPRRSHCIRRHRAPVAAALAALVAAMAGPASSALSAESTRDGTAPGRPGATSHFDLARKDCVGTARNSTSKVWFTVAGGVLSDVYYPTVDNTNVETLQYIVTDGATFTDLQTRDTTYTVTALDRSGMACRVTSTAKNGRYVLTTDYVTDAARASVVMQTTLTPRRPSDRLKVYVRFDGTINGNGGGGQSNAGADDAVVDTSTGTPVPVSADTDTKTIAANRDYGQPVFAALRADRAFVTASSGYAGTPSDGLSQLDTTRRLTHTYNTVAHGNVVQTAQLDAKAFEPFTVALGFGGTRSAAVGTAERSARQSFARTRTAYATEWWAYDAHLTPPARLGGMAPGQLDSLERAYYLSANVLKASEDKTFPGAIAASLASPWGQAISAADPALTYFGSYREVFARDLYETFTGLLADGDVDTARAAVRFLLERQQQPDGSMPRNSLLNGRTAPDSFGVQLDEVAYPILMARSVGLTDSSVYTHIKRAADFIVAHGPAFGAERWEEQSGYSPSTIAAEIAGLAAAGWIAERNGDLAGARTYRAAADDYQRNVKRWTVTTTGQLSRKPYFLRLSKAGDPNAAVTYNLGNGGPDADQRSVVDAGFLELVRLGVLPDADPAVAASLPLVDSVLQSPTAVGAGFYRYGTTAPGTEDGYGDCNVADSTTCTVQGKPWAATCGNQPENKGSGHLWPVLDGERAECALATGNRTTASTLWAAMARTGSGVGLIPEQAWENADQVRSPLGTPPECASIGFRNGKATGSASPLTWAAGQFVRLSADLRGGAIAERPTDTVNRYVARTQLATSLAIGVPNEGAAVGRTVRVAGTAAPGSTIDVKAVNTDIDGATATVTTMAGRNGCFAVDIGAPPGTVSLAVSSTTSRGATAFAQRTVVRDVVPGRLILGVDDPTGDDNGPGTYAYPTAADFRPGAYDLQRFEVYDSGTDTVSFRVRTADLSPTFGSPIGAQLLDVYVRDPAGGLGSTAAAYPERNYTTSAGWTRMIEVQGFGQRFVDPTGNTVGPVAIRASAETRYITFTVTKSALGGTPGKGWSFGVVLTGQDGFSTDQARRFAPTPTPDAFGVCSAPTVGADNPICAVEPQIVPKALDVITPVGVNQAAELDPVRSRPVTVAGVEVP